jgi:hypothetical protein
MPKVAITAIASPRDPKAIDVSWSSPGSNDAFIVYAIGPDGVFKKWTGKVPAGKAVFHGQPGQFYWFWASVTTDLGWQDAGGSQVVWLASDHRSEQ